MWSVSININDSNVQVVGKFTEWESGFSPSAAGPPSAPGASPASSHSTLAPAPSDLFGRSPSNSSLSSSRTRRSSSGSVHPGGRRPDRYAAHDISDDEYEQSRKRQKVPKPRTAKRKDAPTSEEESESESDAAEARSQAAAEKTRRQEARWAKKKRKTDDEGTVTKEKYEKMKAALEAAEQRNAADAKKAKRGTTRKTTASVVNVIKPTRSRKKAKTKSECVFLGFYFCLFFGCVG
jgi:hypothetical protein